MRRLVCLLACALLALPGSAALADTVRVKDLGRFLGWRDNALVGYGVVTGLAGSGDSPRSEVTQQALRNVLGRFGSNVSLDQVRSRNVAAVMIMATLPASSHVGDRLDVTVTSIGDARSLLGGSLLMTPLMGADQQPYALAQGPLVVGGYRYDANRNVSQKNHPTSALVPGGGVIETAGPGAALAGAKALTFVLNDPDVTTAGRIADAVNASIGYSVASVADANAVRVDLTAARQDVYRLIARIETLAVRPDTAARVVVNERSGTIVAGGDIRISSVVVSQGDVRVSVVVENEASQPEIFGGLAPDARSLIVSNTRLSVETRGDVTRSFPNSTIADLVEGLAALKVGSRDMIGVLQALKAAGALHADIIVQ
ncbi:flagellar basal body P-ring protein FlgI [Caulobacter sp. DWR1-3-2b1]|uniref:flagellar basal body P-ring protein FlgI n=1 Tax=Caulobacter sp. DWR1-3-2b1 TaxID=2804670 RepID=UPI003CF55296